MEREQDKVRIRLVDGACGVGEKLGTRRDADSELVTAKTSRLGDYLEGDAPVEGGGSASRPATAVHALPLVSVVNSSMSANVGMMNGALPTPGEFVPSCTNR